MWGTAAAGASRVTRKKMQDLIDAMLVRVVDSRERMKRE